MDTIILKAIDLLKQNNHFIMESSKQKPEDQGIYLKEIHDLNIDVYWMLKNYLKEKNGGIYLQNI